MFLTVKMKTILLLSSSGPGTCHSPRLFSKTGLNSCLKRTRAEAIIRETPTTHQKLFKDHALGLGLALVLLGILL